MQRLPSGEIANRCHTAKAKAAYQVFHTFWKDAEPKVPILIEAKGEYAEV